MAEAIPYGTIRNVLYKLGSLAFKEFVSIFRVDKDMDKLQETLGTIKAVLLDAEEKQESSHEVRNWISRLQEVVYDADDLLDEFEYEHLRQKVLARGQVRKFFSSSNPLAFGLKTSNRIKEIRQKLDEIAADKSKFNLREIVLGDVRVKNSGRETASIVRSVIIGRESNKQDIIELLLQEKHNQEEDNISIVAIVGLGGLGKTTLAQLVFNDATIVNYFNTRVWVCVSQEFDVKVIFQKMLESVTGKTVGELALVEIQKQLETNLRDKRYLVVLDDVWNENDLKWDNFSKYLVKGGRGSKILVTSRSRNVASTMRVNFPYVLEGLNEDKSWVLFEQVAFDGLDNVDPKLKVIGKDLAQRCKGVPLAIKCLGSLMRQKPNEQYWSTVKENKIWKLLEKNDDVFPVLKLSYFHLPSHLKQCFAFCSIFPKDFKISKDLLIQLWGAQGYNSENIQDIGDECFNDLLSRSFFQEVEKDYKGNIVCCKMHDLIHDLAQLVAGSSFYVVKDDEKKISKGVHHVLLECMPSQEYLRYLSKTKRIRTLLWRSRWFLEHKSDQNIKISSFNRCSLRILDLSYLKINVLSNTIGKLKHLRFLNLSNNYDLDVLPNSITSLHNLQTLKLKGCKKLKEIPRDIGKLISLEYVEIQGCGKLKCLPKGLGELTSLQRLDRFIVSHDELSFSTGAMLNELSELNSLGGNLVIENLEKVRNVGLESKEANLKEKKYLQSLELIWDWCEDGDEKDEQLLDNLEPHPNLKELRVFGYKGARFSRWLSSITNLVQLHIEDSHCQYLPPLDHLPYLSNLSLSYFYNLEYMADDDDGREQEHGSSTTTSNFVFPSLKEFRLWRCLNLKGWWKRKIMNEGSTAVLPLFPCLSKLDIDGCPYLTSMPLFPSLDQELHLCNSSVRPLQQTLTMKMASPSSISHSSATLLPLCNLKRLILFDIDDVEVLPDEFLQNLTSLEYLKLVNCYKLASLVPQRMQYCRLTSLQHLKIYNCPTLAAMPEWIPDLTTLKTLKIKECRQLLSLPEGMHLLNSLQELKIDRCPCLSALLNWIPNPSSLKILDLSHCPELTFLHEGMPLPTTLQKLQIYECPRLFDIDHEETGRGIQWHHIAHVPNICIDGSWWKLENNS